ncbi:terminal nucleotidyltransferase 5A-like [Rhopilema esculentum]|uniref:terminal nucleotidyltransferase 5A-like n=1 Tax=Rhopilema esculentum TaxID=499914 RepID=UPI0031D5110B|eukprot:gene17527-9151_t
MANSQHMLTCEEVSRLDEVLGTTILVHGRGNFPTLEVKPKSLIRLLLSQLADREIIVHDVRLNGSTASYVLNVQEDCNSNDLAYNDLDLIFNVELKSQSHFHQVKSAVLESLKDFLPDGVCKDRMGSCTLKEAYVRKMVKVTNKPDNWSLIALANKDGRNIELKFVDSMRRQFEFSIDSFQIILDSLLKFYDTSDVGITPDSYPTVSAESVYGDFEEAKYHLVERLIATKNPEEIRGGGLLKYCSLLVKQFKPVNPDFKTMEKYMCSRFFIDFKDIYSQHQKLENYLNSHFVHQNDKKCEYLRTLYKVVEKSTVCLMLHERNQTLQLIANMANSLRSPPKYQQITVFYSVPNYMYAPGCGSNNTATSKEYVVLGKWESNPNEEPKAVSCY